MINLKPGSMLTPINVLDRYWTADLSAGKYGI